MTADADRVLDQPRALGRLTVTDLSLSFGPFAVLKSVTMRIEPGIITGVIGSNGSGKTSLLNCINGVYRPQHGRVELDGTDLTSLSAHRRTALGIARTFQHIEAPRGQRVLAYTMLGRYPLHGRRGAVVAGLALRRLDGTEAADARAAMAALEQVGLAQYATAEIGSLPYGLVKRIDLARALASSPRLLLLDEPAAGLSLGERTDLMAILNALKDDRQTICLIEHDMGLISTVCDRVTVLSSGETLADGELKEVMQRPDVRRSFLGE